jgi:hypothetical protein
VFIQYHIVFLLDSIDNQSVELTDHLLKLGGA